MSIAGGTGLGIAALDRPNEIKPLVEGPGAKSHAEISPDGRWLAYQASESGRFQVFVRPFPNVNDGRWQITTDQTGGARPIWNRNGRELVYVTGTDNAPIPKGALDVDRTIMSVPIQTKTGFEYGKPTRLFTGRYSMTLAMRAYDVSPDGQKFLMIKEAQTDASAVDARAVIVVNWFEELKARLPPTP
jgi:Tol biopolymer transport system component